MARLPHRLFPYPHQVDIAAQRLGSKDDMPFPCRRGRNILQRLGPFEPDFEDIACLHPVELRLDLYKGEGTAKPGDIKLTDGHDVQPGLIP